MITPFDLSSRVGAVIGAGSGIGAAVAQGLAKAGAHVVCLDIDGAAATVAAGHIRREGGSATSAVLDICDGAAVHDALAAVHADHRRLDVVVSTPGVNVRKLLLRYEDEEFDRVVRVNLKGSFHVLRAAGRLMCGDGRGSIILFSSIRSQVVEPGQSIYAATKAGIVQMVRTAAAEFGGRGVRVNAIAPGVVETPLTAPIKANAGWYDAYGARSALGRWAAADEMIGPAVFLASDASSYVTGTVLFVDGGWTAIDGRFTPPGMEST